MEKIFNLFLVAFLIVFLGPSLGAIIGSWVGWVVGLLFAATSQKTLIFFGLENFNMWEIGAILGFISGFFRATK